MKLTLRMLVGVMVVLLAFAAMAQDTARQGMATSGPVPTAAPRGPQNWVVPASSIERPEDAGVRAHTNIVFRSLDGTNKPTRGQTPDAIAAANPNVTLGQYVETPQSLGCIYLSSPSGAGCVPNYNSGSGGPSAGGWGAIAIVEAGDDSTAAGDLAAFDSYWGLPAANFVKVEMTNSCAAPPDCSVFGWCAEDALDEDYAHVYAPSATIVMVEACSNSNADLLAAEAEAFDVVAKTYGGGDVSNSWGEGEFAGQTADDPIFSTWGNGLYGYEVTAFASAGDSGCGAAWPSSDPWLVSSGGTSIYRATSNGHFNYEGCWSGSGGGTSSVETWNPTFTGWGTGPDADFQYPIFGESNRATPDFASNSDPASGVYIYQTSQYGGWSCCWGGTSEASPSLAAIVNRAANKLSTCFFNPVDSTCYFYNAEDTLLYSQLPTALAYKTNFYDVTKGSNGCKVSKGWDYCTGVGSPRKTLGK